MREISRFAGQALDEPSAFDQKVRLLRERTRLEASRLSEGEDVQAWRNEPGIDERASRESRRP